MAKTETQSRGKVTRETTVVISSVTLSGVAASYAPHTATVNERIKKITMTYISAATAAGSVGVSLMLGTHNNPIKYAMWISETTKAQWSVVDIPVSKDSNDLDSGDVLVLRVGTGKTKAGMVNVQIELSENR